MSTANFDILTTMFEFNSFGQSLNEQILIEGKEGDLDRFVFSKGGFSANNEVFPDGSDHINGNAKNMCWPRAEEEMSDNGIGSLRGLP